MRFLIFPGIDRKLLLKENFRGVFIKLHDEKKKKKAFLLVKLYKRNNLYKLKLCNISKLN